MARSHVYLLLFPAIMTCLMDQAASGKVLILSAPVISHMNELNELGAELKRMGHEVYQVIPNGFEHVGKVTSTGIEPIFYNNVNAQKQKAAIEAKLKNYQFLSFLISAVENLYQECKDMMDDKIFLKKVTEMGFDMALIDGFPFGPCRFILPYHLDIPYVHQFSSTLEWMIRVPYLPSFVPAYAHAEHFHVSDKMSFKERLLNSASMVMNTLITPPPFITDNTLLYEYAPELSWADLVRKSQLFLVTRDHLLEWPTVTTPNVIVTPGITVQPAKALPEDLERIFRETLNGVVVVSFGSAGGDFEQSVYERMFEAFGKLKQTVIMRYIKKDITQARENAPANVHLVSWMPQNDMLGHNKTGAFMTHCGNNGQYEALYHGVPMLGVPLFAEQHHNAFRIVSHEYGVKIDDIKTASVDDIHDALNEVLANEIYSQNIKHASAIMKSDPMLPREKLAYWVDHVMKYGGEHLRPASMDMSLVQFLMIDIFVFLITLAILLTVFCYILMRKVCCKKQSKSKED